MPQGRRDRYYLRVGHGSARYGVRRRDRGMDDSGVGQRRRPGVEFLAVRDGERQVVQAGPRLVERVLAPVPMPGEPRANVTNRQPEMVDTPDHAPAHRVLTWAASGRRD